MTARRTIDLAVEVVSSFVRHNPIEGAALPGLLAQVHGMLSALEQDEGARRAPRRRQPAVAGANAGAAPTGAPPPAAPPDDDSVVCLECGARQKALKRHLAVVHSMSVHDYRRAWNLPPDAPVVAPSYSARRRAIAHQMHRARACGRANGEGATTGGALPAAIP